MKNLILFTWKEILRMLQKKEVRMTISNQEYFATMEGEWEFSIPDLNPGDIVYVIPEPSVTIGSEYTVPSKAVVDLICNEGEGWYYNLTFIHKDESGGDQTSKPWSYPITSLGVQIFLSQEDAISELQKRKETANVT